MLRKLVSIVGIMSICVVSSVHAQKMFNVPVQDAKEVYKTVTVQVPVQKCHPVQLQQQVEVPCPSQGQPASKTDRNTLGIDTIIGAAAGAVVGGATIDRHKSSDTGKIVGGVLGAIGANQLRGRLHQGQRRCYETKTVTDQRCETTYEYQEKTVSDGWLLCSSINGNRVCVKSPQKRDTLTVTVR